MSLGKKGIVDEQINSHFQGYQKDIKSLSEKSDSRRKCLMTIAEKVCDSQYGNMQLGGKNEMIKQTDFEIRDFIIKNVLQQKIRFTKNIGELQKLYLEAQKEKETLAKRVLELEESNEQLRKVYNNPPITPTPIIEDGPTFDEPDFDEPDFDEYEVKEDKEVKKNNVLISGSNVFDINKEYGKMNVYHIQVIRAIGECGYSETNDIVAEAMKNLNVKETFIRQTLNELVDFSMVSLDKISTPIRKTLSLYGLTELGEVIYKKEFNKKAVTCEKVRLVEMHASINHAYCIKDTAKILADLGYTDICYDSPKNTIEVAAGRRYVPDITAMFDNKTKTYWEVELGHHKDSDFFEKLDKAVKVSDVIYVIVNDAQTWEKVKKQIVGYKLKLTKEGRTVKLTVYLGTMIQLSKKSAFFQNPECKFDMNLTRK